VIAGFRAIANPTAAGRTLVALVDVCGRSSAAPRL